jgi:hypothetical protein
MGLDNLVKDFVKRSVRVRRVRKRRAGHFPAPLRSFAVPTRGQVSLHLSLDRSLERGSADIGDLAGVQRAQQSVSNEGVHSHESTLWQGLARLSAPLWARLDVSRSEFYGDTPLRAWRVHVVPDDAQWQVRLVCEVFEGDSGVG